MAKKTISCPICGKSIERTYYEEDIGLVEDYCDCPNCGYYSRMSYSPVEEGISFVNNDFDYISVIKEAWNRMVNMCDKDINVLNRVDCISRALVMNAFSDVLDRDFPYISEVTPRERIEAIPAADVQPVVRGKWLDTTGWGKGKCSSCGFVIDWDDVPAWLHKAPHFSGTCPNCGADMREDGTDNGN